MKTETAIVLVVLIIGGVAAYKLFSQAQVRTANTPLGANAGTLQAAASVGGALLTNLENFFGNNHAASVGYTGAADTNSVDLSNTDSYSSVDWSQPDNYLS